MPTRPGAPTAVAIPARARTSPPLAMTAAAKGPAQAMANGKGADQVAGNQGACHPHGAEAIQQWTDRHSPEQDGRAVREDEQADPCRRMRAFVDEPVSAIYLEPSPSADAVDPIQRRRTPDDRAGRDSGSRPVACRPRPWSTTDSFPSETAASHQSPLALTRS
jgi:hypothetical protein